jgi:hypothetical protein
MDIGLGCQLNFFDLTFPPILSKRFSVFETHNQTRAGCRFSKAVYSGERNANARHDRMEESQWLI